MSSLLIALNSRNAKANTSVWNKITSGDNLDREKTIKIWVIYEDKKYV